MSSANETAEAILFVIKRLLKWIALSAAATVVLFFSVIKFNEFWDWFTVGRFAEKVEVNLRNAAPNECAYDYPYFYTIQNNSGKTIEKVNFSVEIRKKGYSNTINNYTSLTDTKILKNSESTLGCFKAQRNDYKGEVSDKDVDLNVSYKFVKFAK